MVIFWLKITLWFINFIVTQLTALYFTLKVVTNSDLERLPTMSKFISVTKTIIVWLCVSALALGTIFTGMLPSVYAAPQYNPVDDALQHALDQHGQARVVVVLRAPISSRGIWAQSLQIAQTQKAVLDTLPTGEFTPVYRYQMVAAMVGTATAEGLEYLRQHPDVRLVALDMPVMAATLESAALMGVDHVWSEFGFTGQGVNVAIIDSGVDATHPDLVGRVVAQHCFSQASCPPHSRDEGDSALDENGHGTHIAGIIAGRGATGPQGIAPGAGIVGVRVLDAQGAGWTSDVVAALDWIVINQWQYAVKIINLSLGGGQYAGICDAADANTVMLAAAVNAARNAGIIVFAAAGNQGYSNALMSPACIASVVSVGSVYDSDLGPRQWDACSEGTTAADQISCFSNSGAMLDLLAPGAWIEAAMPGGGRRSDAGTSMAAAHASAVAALLLQADRNLLPAQLESTLKAQGVPLTDPRNGYVVPRIDALAAVRAVVPPPPTPTPVPTLTPEPEAAVSIVSGMIVLQGRSDYSGIAIRLSTSACDGLGVASANAALNAVTDARGYFAFNLLATHTYQCLHIRHDRYLSGQRVLNDTFLTGTTLFLPAGDLNGDGVINIFDLTRVGASYGTDDAVADLNGDGMVNIFDLTMIAGNYGRQSPVVDWQ